MMSKVKTAVRFLGTTATVYATMFCPVTMAAASGPKEGTIIANRGDWNLYHVDSYELAVGSGQRIAVNGACVAENIDDNVHVHLVALIPQDNPAQQDMFGSVVLQLSSDDWFYPPSLTNINLAAGGLTLFVAGTLYDVDKVNFNFGGYENLKSTLQTLSALGGAGISILDFQNSLMAEMSTDGLAEIFDDMLACGAV